MSDTRKHPPKPDRFTKKHRTAKKIHTDIALLGWQPIETAPKDGTLVVLWDRRENFRPYVGIWSHGWKRDSDGAGDFYPTHWMSLPNDRTLATQPAPQDFDSK